MIAKARHVVDLRDFEEQLRRIRELLLIRQENGIDAALVAEMRRLLLGRDEAQTALCRTLLHLIVEPVEAALRIVGIVGAPTWQDNEGDRRIDGRDLRMSSKSEVALLVAESVVDPFPRLIFRDRLTKIFKLDGKIVLRLDFFAHLVGGIRLAVLIAAAREEIIYAVSAQAHEEEKRRKADRDRQLRILWHLHWIPPLHRLLNCFLHYTFSYGAASIYGLSAAGTHAVCGLSNHSLHTSGRYIIRWAAKTMNGKPIHKKPPNFACGGFSLCCIRTSYSRRRARFCHRRGMPRSQPRGCYRCRDRH